MRGKVSIIGAGMTGTTTAQWLVGRGIADIVLVDIVEGRAQGRALDLLEAMPIVGRNVSIVGGDDYATTRDSQVVLIMAGVPRRPGLSREDLLRTNAFIVREVVERAVRESPDAVFIVLTNPLDAMAYLTMKAGRLPPQRVVGQSGVLDSARMRAFVALETGISVENIACYVLGGHDEAMVPLVRHSNVAGIPLCEFLPPPSDWRPSLLGRGAAGMRFWPCSRMALRTMHLARHWPGWSRLFWRTSTSSCLLLPACRASTACKVSSWAYLSSWVATA